jgi:hypothetical protein
MRTRYSEAPVGALCALAACAVVCAGCARKPPAAPPAVRAAEPPRAWPQGRSAPVKISDQLILSIPLQYELSAIDSDPKAPPPSPRLFAHQEAQFDFFLPDFTGYTLQNHHNEFDANKVEVVYLHSGDPHETEPDVPGEYPPNMLKRALAQSLNASNYKDQYGLRCYQGRVPSARLTCYGPREGGEDIMLTTLQPPYAPGEFPQLQARYFSKRYGGVRIAWRTSVQNLPHWREIDAQIWKFIDAWNVAAPAPPGSPKP